MGSALPARTRLEILEIAAKHSMTSASVHDNVPKVMLRREAKALVHQLRG